MLKIRLMRIGAKQKPFYRIVVVDERNKRDGAYLDLLGTYNPLTEPKDIKLDKVKLAAWLKKGAQKSDGLLRMLKEAPQRPPRKPKKERQQATVDSGQAKTAEPKTAEKPIEEAPKEEEPASEQPAQTPATVTESPNSKKGEAVDDSAENSQSTESDTSESVQNKKNEGSA